MKYLFIKTSFLFILLIFGTLTLEAQTVVPLYDGKIPGAKPTPPSYRERLNKWGAAEKVSVPTLTCYLPAGGDANTAILVIPGGAYVNVALAVEGDPIARALANMGIAAFVLKYRLPSDSIMTDKTTGPLQDAEMAMQLIRKNASQWHINPNRVGVLGFSAGGHLASTLGTHFNNPVVKDMDRISVRPDFMALIYPVISFGQYAHAGSRECLIGKKPVTGLIDLFSNEKQVSAQTPPTFLVHAGDDSTVPVENTLLFYKALLQHKIPAEMHIYPKGGHGFGLKNPNIDWLDRLKDWLIYNGWL
ncbi:alpha/beta hydrolase [Mucilaginibacter segetis]|uniref:Alpha/beta hydrolase n=1 Tax=Mucilaginibacter segetis TaxID=2793071 RepID=A0A934PVF5_9SPHI|nr:alpha/beta hydrolase [Mucilaginibacter segetis]MBK0379723.1 alpha/beta hydrolase [Mucilaginibacter segetis]